MTAKIAYLEVGQVDHQDVLRAHIQIVVVLVIFGTASAADTSHKIIFGILRVPHDNELRPMLLQAPFGDDLRALFKDRLPYVDGQLLH